MFFRCVKLFFPLAVLVAVFKFECCLSIGSNSKLNGTIFAFHDINECSRNEYYNLNNFECVACKKADGNLQPSANKFSCECASPSIAVAIYDAIKEHPICVDSCPAYLEPQQNIDAMNGDKKCQPNATTRGANGTKIDCTLKFVNSTASSQIVGPLPGTSKQIRIGGTNPHGDCSTCDLQYNFRYRDFCITNALLKPYLSYNSFWQPTTTKGHFGDLKFVAFFCLALRNGTACNQLANLCVMSHFSFDKNSPCSTFLLAQASDAVRYASTDEHLHSLRPFLFYKKGKQTAKWLSEPMPSIAYSLSNHSNKWYNRMQFFSTIYALDGSLRRWGRLKLSHVNLCRLHSLNCHGALDTQQAIRFARRDSPTTCQLTLENLIDLANIYANNNFMSLFLNFTSDKTGDKVFMQAVPILIESLSPENGRNQPEEWQLVKRFQLIEAHPRHHFGSQKPSYEDDYKLLLYRSLRYVENFEIHYKIHSKNHISIPIVKLQYRHIELSGNSTLDEVYNFKFHIHFVRVGESARRQVLNEITIPALLLVAIAAALLRAYNYKKRRAAATAVNFCDFSCIIEFCLHLISNMANAFLICFLLHAVYNSLEFLAQRTVEITLPITKDHSSLEMIIYAALVLKIIFLCIHFWRISHFDLFFIDWERPKSYDNNHFNLKSNLETSSVCSSVRTFVSENNVSAWRIFFTANEWIRLSATQKTSILVQGFLLLIFFKLLDKDHITQNDTTLKLFVIITCHIAIYTVQLLFRILLVNHIFGNPLQKFIDLCSLANISVFALLEPSYGFYIHGRSPHGFSDTDMSSMIVQLQRESQNMCGRRGLLSDSDQQTYIIMPPINLRTYFEKLLIPFQRSCSISQTHFQKEINSIESNLERTSIAYSSVNRFFCAFIDHAIKDMDYIIKERTLAEKLFNCEFDNYLTENKGTFYIDSAQSFDQLFLYGNSVHIFIAEFLLLLSLYTLTANLTAAIVVVCLLNKLFQCIFRNWLRQNVSTKTLIDKRFLM